MRGMVSADGRSTGCGRKVEILDARDDMDGGEGKESGRGGVEGCKSPIEDERGCAECRGRRSGREELLARDVDDGTGGVDERPSLTGMRSFMDEGKRARK